MEFYMAPMEGITDSIYRRLHHRYFPGVDRYYTPFFSPTVHRALTPREARELPPAKDMDVTVIPQLLTKNAEDFIWMSTVCQQLGYGEVNLNLGCPSGTVTAKGKGSGMLREPDLLEDFLERIFSGSPLPISIKTRIGFSDPAEFPRLMEIFNQYPICELTIHPRVRQDFYKGAIQMDAFSYAMSVSKAPLCYNGNLTTAKEITDFSKQHPNVSAVMLGRALVGDPGMLSPGGTTPQKLGEFLDALLDNYASAFGSARNAMFRLKENWRYLMCLFQPDEKLQKALRKATDMDTYKAVTAQILSGLPMRPSLSPDW